MRILHIYVEIDDDEHNYPHFSLHDQTCPWTLTM
jgi:hypothetical protein